MKNIHKKQRALYERWKAGDERALGELCMTLEGLVVKQALKFRASGIDLEDLKAEGFLAVVDAANKWDPDRGTFAAAAYHRVLDRLLEIARSSGAPVVFAKSRPDRRMQRNLCRKIREYEDRGFEPRLAIEKAAVDLSVTPDLAQQFLAMRASGEMQDFDAISDTESIDDRLADDAVRQTVQNDILYGLGPIERDIVGKMSGSGESLELIAARHSVSRSVVSRVRDDLMPVLRERCDDAGISPSDFL